MISDNRKSTTTRLHEGPRIMQPILQIANTFEIQLNKLFPAQASKESFNYVTEIISNVMAKKHNRI